MASAGDYIVAISQTVMALCAFITGLWLSGTIVRNHLTKGFRPVLSAIVVHAIGATLNYSILATNRWEHIIYHTLMTPLPWDTITTNVVNAFAWIWLMLAFMWNYDVGRKPE